MERDLKGQQSYGYLESKRPLQKEICGKRTSKISHPMGISAKRPLRKETLKISNPTGICHPVRSKGSFSSTPSWQCVPVSVSVSVAVSVSVSVSVSASASISVCLCVCVSVCLCLGCVLCVMRVSVCLCTCVVECVTVCMRVYGGGVA